MESRTQNKSVNLRRFIRTWHKDDPEYGIIVNKLPPTREYCSDIDARLDEVVSGTVPLLSQGLARSIVEYGPDSEKAKTVLKYLENALEVSLNESIEKYQDIYAPRYVMLCIVTVKPSSSAEILTVGIVMCCER